MNTKLFVSWAAVSSEEQVKTKRQLRDDVVEDEKESLRVQIESNHEHCKRHDGRILIDLVVDGQSRDITLLEDARDIVEGYMVIDGEQRRCKPYAELHRLIKERAFDVLVFLDLGRLGRDAVLSQSIIRLCHRAGIVTYSTKSPPMVMDRPLISQQDYMIQAFSAIGYQEEISEIKRRNAIGMAGRVERGDFAYKVPFPWIEKRDGKSRWVDLDERGAEALRLFVDLYVNFGRSAIEISEILNAGGYRLPENKLWYKQKVENIINEIWLYAGRVELNRLSQTGRPQVSGRLRWPTPLTEEQAQSVEDEQYRRYAGRGSVRSVHRYSQCVYCATCGGRMTASYRSDYKNKGKKYAYERYNCMEKHPRRYIQAWRIHDAIAAAVEDICTSGDLASFLPPLDDRSAVLQSRIDALDADMMYHRQRLERIGDAYTDGAMDLASYRRQTDRVRESIVATQEEIDTVKRALIDEMRSGSRLSRLEEVARHGRAMLVEEDISKANAFFRRIFRVTAKEGRVLRVETI